VQLLAEVLGVLAVDFFAGFLAVGLTDFDFFLSLAGVLAVVFCLLRL
jgi:hypothetical protein